MSCNSKNFITEETVLELGKAWIKEYQLEEDKKSKRRFIIAAIAVISLFLFITTILTVYIIEYWKHPPIRNFADNGSVQQIGDNNNNSEGSE